MVSLGLFNTRMKDFGDLFVLSKGASTDARVSLRESAGAILVQRAGQISLAAGEHAYSARTHLGWDYSAISQLNLVCERSPTDPEDKPNLVQVDAGWSWHGKPK